MLAGYVQDTSPKDLETTAEIAFAASNVNRAYIVLALKAGKSTAEMVEGSGLSRSSLQTPITYLRRAKMITDEIPKLGKPYQLTPFGKVAAKGIRALQTTYSRFFTDGACSAQTPAGLENLLGAVELASGFDRPVRAYVLLAIEAQTPLKTMAETAKISRQALQHYINHLKTKSMLHGSRTKGNSYELTLLGRAAAVGLKAIRAIEDEWNSLVVAVASPILEQTKDNFNAEAKKLFEEAVTNLPWLEGEA
jgi:predicted transcriptional regulator